MRRGMLTFGNAGPSPFTVGGSVVSGTTDVGNQQIILTSLNPAPRAGTITSAGAYGSSSGNSNNNIYIITATMSGSTMTVKGVSPLLTFLAGANNYTGLSLPIPSGGYIGWFLPSGARWGRSSTTTGVTCWYQTTTAVPVVGNTYSMLSQANTDMSVQGTGS